MLCVPRNVVRHIEVDHPIDAPYLAHLQEIVDEVSHVSWAEAPGQKTVLYARFDGIWLRVVLIPGGNKDFAVPASLYRR
jgi:hypothetical protein